MPRIQTGGGVFSWLSYKEHFTEGEWRPTKLFVLKSFVQHSIVILLRKMMKTLFALCLLALMALVTVEAAVRWDHYVGICLKFAKVAECLNKNLKEDKETSSITTHKTFKDVIWLSTPNIHDWKKDYAIKTSNFHKIIVKNSKKASLSA